jgi:MFS family permease
LPIVGTIHGWQLTFFFIGVPGLVVALMMATVREPARKGLLLSTSTHVPFSAVMRRLWRQRAGYGALMLGVAVFVMVVYAFNLWGPAYFMRVFGYSAARAGWIFGLVMLVAGTAGLLVAGSIADAWRRRGRTDAYVRTILSSIVLMMPFAASLAFVEDDRVAIPMIFFAVFFSAFQGGLTGGALQLMTPNQLRGRVSAVYFMIANLIGLGLGPTVVAACTDYVFADDRAIGKSMALVAVVFCPLGAVILATGLRRIRQMLEEASTWHQDQSRETALNRVDRSTQERSETFPGPT